MYSTHINSYSLPPQMIPINKKDKKWKKDTLDVLENIGLQQIMNKSKLLENYQMLKGKFIYKHYMEDEEYQDLVSMLSTEFKLPTRLRHYDIISQVINTLCGEMQKRPDIYTVKCFDENSKNNFIREKTKLLLKYVTSEIENWIEMSLFEEGLTLEGKEFESEEEQQQFLQQVEQRRKELTPSEIENYMNTQWSESAEIWANAVLALDEQRFKIDEMKLTEFLDMLASDQCYRHFYLTSKGYSQETWNPITVFSNLFGDNLNTEDSEYVGRITYMTYSQIIDKFGYKMKESDISKLEKWRKDRYKDNVGTGNSYEDYSPGGTIPYLNYPEHKQVTQLLGRDPLAPMDASKAVVLDNYNNDSANYGKCRVTETYWMSQEMYGKYCYIDGETGQVLNIIVDETFDTSLIENIKEYKGTFNDEYKQLPNTIVWTWLNVVYKGIKINPLTEDTDEIYLDIGPNDFQGKGDIELYGNKLPVVGGIFNGRNGESMSLVDLMKPHQIGYNAAINQAYEIMQREKGRFMLMDANMIPNDKDWGGPRNYERFMMIARELGIAPVDASPANAKNSSFSHFQVIDLDESQRIMNRLRVAETFENFALKQVGITPQRLGTVLASETATGVQQAVNQSYAQTESYFTKFFNYIKRCMQMNLDIAQFCAIREKDITLSYTMSDLSRAFIKITGSDLVGRMFGLFVVNSQEVLRQLETVRSLFVNNPNTGASVEDITTAIMSNSLAEIKTQMKTSSEKKQREIEAQREHEQQMQQQQIEAQQQAEQLRLAKEDERLDKKLANDRYINEIRALGFSRDTDSNENNIPDVLEVQKFNQQMQKDSEDILFRNQQEQNRYYDQINKSNQAKMKLDLEQQKVNDNRLKQTQDYNLKNKELDIKKLDSENKLKIAKENKNRFDTPSKKDKLEK